MILKGKKLSVLWLVVLAVLPILFISTAGCRTVTRLVDVPKDELVRKAASQKEAAPQAGKSAVETCSMPWDCAKKEEIAPQTGKIVEAVLLTGDVVKFDERGGKFIPPGTVEGFDSQGAPVMLPVDQISFVRVEKIEYGSCPFVYSYDGARFVLDAEPLGGSIAQGLEKTDYSRLEHLKPSDGGYRLLFRNKAGETQYIDEVKLLIIDHQPGQRIIPDLNGEMYAVDAPVVPAAAVDEAGGDLMKFVREQDNVVWQTRLPDAASIKGGDLRHHLTFAFPRPREAKTARLLVNAGTALWGSHMVGEMLELRGNKVDAWYKAINTPGPELFGLIEFNAREELYVLKVYVKEGDAWVQRGYIPGGGPLISEDRGIELDLSSVQGDTVEIRLNPPMGFWTIDYLGMDYGEHSTPMVKETAIASAADRQGKDAKGALVSLDKNYVRLQELDDWVKTDFNAPVQPEGTERTIFLRTAGYYELHLSKDRPEQTELLQKLAAPGMIVEYSMERYRQWRSRQSADK